MFTLICRAEEINEGELYRVDINDKPLLVTKFEAHFFVTDSICTHEEADLSLGNFSTGTLTCPLHRAQFDIATGEVKRGPDGAAAASIPRLKVYPSKVENGELWAEI